MKSKELLNYILYFVIVVLIVGSSGIWLPYSINIIIGRQTTSFEIYQNLTTYFVTIIAAGCIDLIIAQVKKAKTNNTGNPIGGVLFFLLLLIIAPICLIIVHVLSINGSKWAIWGIILGVILSYILWWSSNWKRKDLNPINSLGGQVP